MEMESESTLSRFLKSWKTLNESQRLEISISILKKSFEERTEDDLALLAKCTENINFFQDVGKEVHHECCHYLTFSYADADELIIKEGDLGTSFFIILKGSVGVSRYITKVEPEPNIRSPSIFVQTKEPPVESKSIVAKSMTKLDDTLFKMNEPHKDNPSFSSNSDKARLLKEKLSTLSTSLSIVNALTRKKEEKVLVEIATLTTGDSFGERALLSNARRKATIITKEPTYFACLEKQYFNLTLKERETKIHHENITFLMSLQYFRSFSYHLIEQIYYLGKKQRLNKNQFVYSEGDMAESVYIIKIGEFKLLKSIEIKNSDLTSPTTELVNNPLIKKKLTRKNGELAIFSPGELFGDLEVVKDIPRTSSIICDSPAGELYVIPKNVFLNNLYTDANFKTFIDNQRQLKLNVHKQRLELIEILTNKNRNLLIQPANHMKNYASPSYLNLQKPLPLDKFEGSGFLINKSHEQAYIDDNSNAGSFFKERNDSSNYRFRETLQIIQRSHLRGNQTNTEKISRKGLYNNVGNLTEIDSPKTRSIQNAHRKVGSFQLEKLKNKIELNARKSYRYPDQPVVVKEKNAKSQILTTKGSEQHEDQNNNHLINLFSKRKSMKPGNLLYYEIPNLPKAQSEATSPDALSPALMRHHSDATSYLFQNLRSSLRVSDGFQVSKDALASPNSIVDVNSPTNMPSLLAGSPMLNKKLMSTQQKDYKKSSIDIGCSNNINSISPTPMSPARLESNEFDKNLSPKKRSKMTIHPLKKSNFLKEVHKTKEFMNFKFTGKIST